MQSTRAGAPAPRIRRSVARRRRALGLAPALAALLLLGACTTGRGVAPAGPPAPPPEATVQPPAAPAGRASAPEAPRTEPAPPSRGAEVAAGAEAARELQLPSGVDPALALARSVLRAEAPDWGPLDREGVAQVLAHAQRERGLPILLLVALIHQESRFDPRAVGPHGSRGLMQIRPFVARDVAARHELPFEPDRTLFDPVANVRLGVCYLGELREAFGTAELALAAYNMGPTRLRRRLDAGHRVEGPYVRALLERWTALRTSFGTTETGIGG